MGHRAGVPNPGQRTQSTHMLDERQRRTAIEEGGGTYRGFSTGDTELGLEPMVYFDDAEGTHGSTMCLFFSDVSAEAVRDSIKRTREAFKRCARIASR